MDAWEFTLAVKDPGADPSGDEVPEGVVGERWMNRVTLVDFRVMAASLDEAVDSAAESQIRLGRRVVRLEPDDLITLAEIAHESGLGWGAAVTLANAQSDDPMPLPVRRMASDRPLWSWEQVSHWLAGKGFIPASKASFAAAANRINSRLARRASP